MGCDIHSVVQILDIYSDLKPWVTVEHRLNGDPRSYDYFAILADVRNGYGFAGVNTGDGFIPISKPRGLPNGFVLDENDCHQGAWMGDHSHSWVTLEEMLNHDLSQKTKKRGFISFDEYKEWKKREPASPDSYSGGISGRGIECVDMARADQLIADGFKETKGFVEDRHEVFVQVEWEISYSGVLAFSEAIRRMKEIASNFYREPKDVRLVFGFDS